MKLTTLLDKPAQSLYSKKRGYLLANRININYKSFSEPKGSEKQRKNCIECSKVGYHSDLFNISFITKCPIHNTHLKTRCPSCGRNWKLPGSHKSEHASCKICGINLTLAELRLNSFRVKDQRYQLIEKLYTHAKDAQEYFEDSIKLTSGDCSLFPDISFEDTSLSLGGKDHHLVIPSYSQVKKVLPESSWKIPLTEVSKSSFKIFNNRQGFTVEQRKRIQENALHKIKTQFYSEFKKINNEFPDYTGNIQTDNNCIVSFMLHYLEDIARNYDINTDYSSYHNKLKGINYGIKTTERSKRPCIYHLIDHEYESIELSQFIYENKLWQILVINFYRFICEHNLYGMLNKKVHVIGGLREMNPRHTEKPDIPYLIKKSGDKISVHYPTCFEAKSLIINKDDEQFFFDEKKEKIRHDQHLNQSNSYTPKRNYQLSLNL